MFSKLMLAPTDVHLVWAVLFTCFSVQIQFSPGWIISSSGLVCEGSWRSFSGHPCVIGVSYYHQHSELALKQNSPESICLSSVVWVLVMAFHYS